MIMMEMKNYNIITIMWTFSSFVHSYHAFNVASFITQPGKIFSVNTEKREICNDKKIRKLINDIFLFLPRKQAETDLNDFDFGYNWRKKLEKVEKKNILNSFRVFFLCNYHNTYFMIFSSND